LKLADRNEIYSLVASRPEPLVSRENRIGVHERIDVEGLVLTELDKKEIKRVQKEIMKRKPDSVAVSLLFSYQNSKHECTLLETLQKIPGLYSVTSSDVLPEFREFERTSTTVLEAYLGPLVIGYIDCLDNSLQEHFPNAKLTLMQSNGGSLLGASVKGKAVWLAISGLAGGVIGSWKISQSQNVRKSITLDMGGTSCDISAINEEIKVQPDNEIAGLPLRIPSVDVKTIGAGGGSIAWLDEVGILHVGPQSAGAEPGPAAYGKGGMDATITDANIVLGRINPDYFVGGGVSLKREMANIAISNLSDKLNLSIEETALGIIKISTSNMVQAIREVTIERGHDPREFVLIPFGGAGPTQCVDIAAMLGIEQILIPPYPGITSAQGLVFADLRTDLMRTILVSEINFIESDVYNVLKDLDSEAIRFLEEQGAIQASISTQWMIDIRYVGQSHEISVPLDSKSEIIADSSRTKFETIHKQRYGYDIQNREIEWVTARVTAIAKSDIKFQPPNLPQRAGWPIDTRQVVLSNGEKVLADIYRRERLSNTQEIEGAAIIEQLDTTIYVEPGWLAVQNNDGSMWIMRDEK